MSNDFVFLQVRFSSESLAAEIAQIISLILVLRLKVHVQEIGKFEALVTQVAFVGFFFNKIGIVDRFHVVFPQEIRSECLVAVPTLVTRVMLGAVLVKGGCHHRPTAQRTQNVRSVVFGHGRKIFLEKTDFVFSSNDWSSFPHNFHLLRRNLVMHSRQVDFERFDGDVSVTNGAPNDFGLHEWVVEARPACEFFMGRPDVVGN